MLSRCCRYWDGPWKLEEQQTEMQGNSRVGHAAPLGNGASSGTNPLLSG